MAAAKQIHLCDLRPGEEGCIEQFDPETPEYLRSRVIALGFVPGTRVRTVRKAPFGDPTEYELRGGRVSLRKTEARLLTVTK